MAAYIGIRTLFPVLLLVVSTIAQSNTINEENSLYVDAVRIYLERSEQEYGRLFRDRDFTKALILKSDSLPDNMPTTVGKYTITYLDSEEIRSKIGKTDQGLTVAELRPINLDKNTLTITVVEYRARLDKKKLTLGLSDGIKMYFRFDCLKNKFVVIRSEFFGV
jgi:hypothetical protein